MKHYIQALFLITLTALSPTTLATEPIGKVTRIQGSAIEEPLGLKANELKLNSPVYRKSEIKTGDNARLQIVFNDQSTILLGEWSFIRLDQFKYRPESPSTSSQLIEILGGTFRFATGFIGKQNNQKVTVKAPVGTIGIRGTDFFGGPLEAGMPKGEIHYGFMLIDGAIDVSNRYGSVVLDEQKEGTFLPMAGNKAPAPPNVWGEEAILEADASLRFK